MKLITPNSSLTSLSTPKPVNPVTLESLIQGLDNRGMLVLLVLLGQHAMELLGKDKSKDNVLINNTKET